MMIPPFFAAWVGHTDDSRGQAEDFKQALDILRIKQETAAEVMGLAATKLADQLAGRMPLNHFRLSKLGVRFELTYMKLRAARFGAAVIEKEDREFIVSAAQLGIKKMARFAPYLFIRKAS
jgi:hypothetical protein